MSNEFPRADGGVELSIIFVNWNSTVYLRQCILSLYEFVSGFEFEIIVVDNASQHENPEALKRQFKRIILIKNPVNLGFAGANNVGFRNSRGRYILFLNPDTKLTGPAVRTMLDRLKSLPDAGIVGCKLLNADLSPQTSCIQAFPTILNQALDTEALRQRWPSHRLWGMAPLVANNNVPAPVEVISGACMMMRRAAFEQVGLFSEDYFMYAEDLDLCYKMNRTGYVNYYLGEAEVIHYGGTSSTPSTATVTKWHSMLQYFVKHRGNVYALRFRAVMIVAALFRLALLEIAALRRTCQANAGYTAVMKWRTILRTLLSHSGARRLETPANPAPRFSLGKSVPKHEPAPPNRMRI